MAWGKVKAVKAAGKTSASHHKEGTAGGRYGQGRRKRNTTNEVCLSRYAGSSGLAAFTVLWLYTAAGVQKWHGRQAGMQAGIPAACVWHATVVAGMSARVRQRMDT